MHVIGDDTIISWMSLLIRKSPQKVNYFWTLIISPLVDIFAWQNTAQHKKQSE